MGGRHRRCELRGNAACVLLPPFASRPRPVLLRLRSARGRVWPAAVRWGGGAICSNLARYCWLGSRSLGLGLFTAHLTEEEGVPKGLCSRPGFLQPFCAPPSQPALANPPLLAPQTHSPFHPLPFLSLSARNPWSWMVRHQCFPVLTPGYSPPAPRTLHVDSTWRGDWRLLVAFQLHPTRWVLPTCQCASCPGSTGFLEVF